MIVEPLRAGDIWLRCPHGCGLSVIAGADMRVIAELEMQLHVDHCGASPAADFDGVPGDR